MNHEDDCAPVGGTGAAVAVSAETRDEVIISLSLLRLALKWWETDLERRYDRYPSARLDWLRVELERLCAELERLSELSRQQEERIAA